MNNVTQQVASLSQMIESSLIYFTTNYSSLIQVSIEIQDILNYLYTYSDDTLLTMLDRGEYLNTVRKWLDENRLSDRNKLTLVMHSKTQNIESIKILIDYLPDSRLVMWEDIILYLCCKLKSIELVDIFMSRAKMNDLRSISFAPFTMACKVNDIRMAKYLINKSLQIDECLYMIILHRIIEHSNVDTIRYFLEDIIVDMNKIKECIGYNDNMILNMSMNNQDSRVYEYISSLCVYRC